MNNLALLDTFITTDFVPSREQVDDLQRAISILPQTEFETEHYFVDGMYCRKLPRKAGTLIIGKVHKADHFFICTLGEIKVWTDTGIKILKAGDIIESHPGTKRVTLALTDAVGITVHKTDNTDLDKIEEELLEPDVSAMFTSGNKLKSPVIESIYSIPLEEDLTCLG